MVIYVEAVIFDNFCLDFLLAYLSGVVQGIKTKKLACALSAVVGSIFALVSPFIVKFTLFFKIFTLFICSALFYLKKNFRGYIKNTFVYAVLSFILCGIMSLILQGEFFASFQFVKGGIVGATALSILLLTYIVRQIIGLINERKHNEKFCKAKVIINDKSVILSALFDSGNLLTDSDGKGIIVSDKNALAPLGNLEKIGEIEVVTATGKTTLSLIKLSKIEIYSQEGTNILNNVTAALSDLPKEYALILPTI